LYQWGRAADVHEAPTSANTTTLSSTSSPGHGEFIVTNFLSDKNWLEPPDEDLWQGLYGVNNPCPTNFRIPTQAEWVEEIASWATNPYFGPFSSALKLPLSHVRTGISGVVSSGVTAFYWSSSVWDGGSENSMYMFHQEGVGYVFNNYRSMGMSIRCIQEPIGIQLPLDHDLPSHTIDLRDYFTVAGDNLDLFSQLTTTYQGPSDPNTNVSSTETTSPFISINSLPLDFAVAALVSDRHNNVAACALNFEARSARPFSLTCSATTSIDLVALRLLFLYDDNDAYNSFTDSSLAGVVGSVQNYLEVECSNIPSQWLIIPCDPQWRIRACSVSRVHRPFPPNHLSHCQLHSVFEPRPTTCHDRTGSSAICRHDLFDH